MDTNNSYPSFLERYKHEIKEGILILLIWLFLGLYFLIPPLKALVDRPLKFAVAGLSVGYSNLSTIIFEKTGVDLGLVNQPTDRDFLFRVQLASYVNQKQSSAILDMAMDPHFSKEQREDALKSLFLFETTTQWIRPFLNELPKGGLPGLYDEKSTTLEGLIQRIRLEGGIRQPLVRAYAEVVFSFMMQAQDAIIRQKALSWVSDVIAEDALMLISNRIKDETDPAVRKQIEEALLSVRAVADPEKAKKALVPIYRNPPWPEVRFPVAIVLAHLGYEGEGFRNFFKDQLNIESISSEKRTLLRLAMSQTPYPRALIVTDRNKNLIQERENARRAQYQYALEKKRQRDERDHVKEILLAQAQRRESLSGVETSTHDKPIISTRVPSKAASTSSRQRVSKSEIKVARVPDQKKSLVPTQPENSGAVPAAAENIEAKATETNAVAAQAASVEDIKTPEVVSGKEPVISEDSIPESAADIPAAVPAGAEDKVAQLVTPPSKSLPEPESQVIAAPPSNKGSMEAVDLIFEIRNENAPVFSEPDPQAITGQSIPVGKKGQATFKVTKGTEEWYQVKSKNIKGWIPTQFLTIYDLSPKVEEDGIASAPAKESKTSKEESSHQDELTYFQAASENVQAFSSPNDKSKPIGTMIDGVAYLSSKSEKVGSDRWFSIEIKDGVFGWVRGIDLQLASVQPAKEKAVESVASLDDVKAPAFKAEWIIPSVKGVGVYIRPSIAAKQLLQISPPKVYKVVEVSEGSGEEWYKIEIEKDKQGWVQMLDVNLTKAPKK